MIRLLAALPMLTLSLGPVRAQDTLAQIRILYDVSVTWHKDGVPLMEQHTWGIAASPFLQGMHRKVPGN